MLESLFTSKARARLLVLLFANPKKFHLRELARAAGCNANAASRELELLEKLGLVSSEKSANLKLFWANPKSPIYEELKAIVLKTDALGSVLREQFKDEKGVEFAFIYGSFAEGREKPHSDIDLMIIGSVGAAGLDKIVRNAENKLGREINYSIFPRREVSPKSTGFVKSVVLGKKIMLAGDENELERLVEKRRS